MKLRKLGSRLPKINLYYIYISSLIIAVTGAAIIFSDNSSQVPVTAKFAECTGAQANELTCWREYYKYIVNNETPKIALSDAEKRTEKNRFIKDKCHEIAHIIGRAAGKKYTDLAEAYGLGTDFCASGYYHGVMQAVADTVGKEKILEKINGICKPLFEKEKYGLPYYNCVHGLGHGVMTLEGNELFLALKDCDGLDGSWEQDSCYSGVFMENIIGEVDPDHFTKYLRRDDPLYPCTAVEEKYKKMCYFLQTDHALIVESANFERVFKLCMGLDNILYSTMCYQSLGRNASSYAVYDLENTRNYCLLGELAYAKDNCLLGSATDFAWRTQKGDEAFSLCSTISDPEILGRCNQTVKNYMERGSS